MGDREKLKKVTKLFYFKTQKLRLLEIIWANFDSQQCTFVIKKNEHMHWGIVLQRG